MDRNLKKRVSEWRARVGYAEAKKSLMGAGYSLSLAQKVLAGTYPDKLKIDKVIILDKILEKK